MKKIVVLLFILVASQGFSIATAEQADERVVQEQQLHYAKVHPLPYYDYSIPRDVYIQIYDVVVSKAYVTYSVISSMTGVTYWHGPSIGYALPADTSLTNPIAYYANGATLEQAEPSGLFSSKNTDGTWVLALQDDGLITPIYTEQKVTTFPFAVTWDGTSWKRADDNPVEFTIKVRQ